MAQITMSGRTTSQIMDKVRKPVGSRRSWTAYEEHALVNALKEIVATGMKADNGFKPAYLGLLEDAMAKALPGTDIRADPHIGSKIHVWKKQFGTLFSMIGTSGFEWNSTTNMIEVQDQEKWDHFVKKDSNAKSMRYKAFPLYSDWLEIFGRDRATGQHAEGFAEAVQEVLQSENQQHVASNGDDFAPVDEVEEDDEPEVNSHNGGTASTGKSKRVVGETSTGKSKRVGGESSMSKGKRVAEEASMGKSKDNSEKKKRKSRVDPGMMEMLAKAWKSTEEHLSDIAKRLGEEPVTEAERVKVFGVLAQIDGLCDEDQLIAAQYLCKDKKNMDLFFTCPDYKKVLMVNMILDGKFV